ncbi:MAG: hypothetical protein IJJ99_08120 [Oscillospiraceae bacterium]|nr:hypothetical protein [Clostridia bacterium]MBQ6431824.1 hypothetical protein [Oscillospiraceae bacterium]
MNEKKLIPANELEYLTVCAAKLTQLAQIVPAIEAGKATDDQTAEAIDAVKYLLQMDMCAGAGEICGHIRDALDPETMDKFLAEKFGESWIQQQAAQQQAEAEARAKRFIPPTYAEMTEKGIDRVRNEYGRR